MFGPNTDGIGDGFRSAFSWINASDSELPEDAPDGESPPTHQPINFRATSPGNSLLRAGALAYAGTFVTLPVTGWFVDLLGGSSKFAISAAFAVYGVSAYKLAINFPEYDIGIQRIGIKLLFGQPVRKLYDTGRHKLFFGESLAPVYTGPALFDPPAFDELTRDDVNVTVDGYFIARVVRPFRWLIHGGPPTIESLMLEFKSRIRVFINNWNEAKDMVENRNLLAEFLLIDSDEAKAKFRKKLEAYAEGNTNGNKPMLPKDGVKRIMEDAGKLCQAATDWGYQITVINTEDVNLPDIVLKAAEERTATEARLEIVRQKQDLRMKMAAEMKAQHTGLTDREIMNEVDIMLGLPVDKSIYAIDLAGIDFSGNTPLGRLVSRFLNPRKGKRHGSQPQQRRGQRRP